MSEDKKYFTAVFPFTELYAKSNPFTTDTPWGRAKAIAVGDVIHENDVYLDALNDIAGQDSQCGLCPLTAQKALDEVNEYVRDQMKLPIERVQPIEDVEQLDLEGAINAKAIAK